MTQSLTLSVFSVFLMMVPGFIFGKRNILNENFLKGLSKVIVTFIFPSLAFTSVLKNFTLDVLITNWQLPLASVLIVFIGYLFVRLLLLFYTIKSDKTRSSFIYQGAFNNYVFLPLAIVSQVMEDKYIGAVVIASLGAEFMVWSLGVFIMNPGSKLVSRESFKHLLSPPLLALYAAVLGLIIFHFTDTNLDQILTDYPVSQYLWNSINTLGLATVPFTLILAGARIAKTDTQLVRSKHIWVITLMRLLIIPALCVGIFHLIFPNNEFLLIMGIISITPVAFNSLVLGEMFDADMKLLSGSVLVTYVLSLITIPLWMLFLAS